MAAGALALLLLAAVIAGAAALLGFSERSTPTDRSETPTPSSAEPFRPDDLDARFTLAAASGEIDGSRWTVWANGDLSCIAFTTVGARGETGEYAEVDAGCLNGYDSSDVKVGGVCVYGCPLLDDGLYPMMYGTVSPRVVRLRFDNDDGSSTPVTIHPPPTWAQGEGRVFTVPISFSWTGWLTGLAADGSVVTRVRYPSDADAAGGPSTPVLVEASLASGIPLSTVDGRPSEADRWEIAIWRNAAGEWCFGTIYPTEGSAVVASDEPGCGSRDELFGRSGLPIDHADVWWMHEASMFGENARWFRYRVVGTVSPDVAAVRIEVDDGRVVEAELYDAPPGFEDLGRLFVAEFRSRHHPLAFEGTGGIAWAAVALGASGDVLGSDEMSM